MKQNHSAIFRISFGLLGLSAIITEVAALVNRNAFYAGNFFSYFTIQANILSVIMLLMFGVLAVKGKDAASGSSLVFKGAVTLYMFMTGVIFAILLAPIEDATLTAVPWDNIVLHYIMPVVVVTDWLLMRFKPTITFKQSLLWLIFPLAYVVYTLIRGAFTNWYPYPFLNPSAHGLTQMIVTIVVLLVFVVLASQLVRKFPAITKSSVH